MAYNALNNLIDAYIYANGVQAITGQILNGVLKQMVSQLGSGYHLMGVAGPETVPASNDYAMAYFAATAGEYTDFGGITLAAGEVAVLLTSGNGSWSKQTIYNVPTGTADLENTANFITNAVTDLVNYYTKTEVDDTLANYPTLEALATALADYYTKTQIDGQKAETDAALADRYTKSETDTKLADYYKKTETYDKDEVDSIIAALSRQEYIVAWDGLAAPDVSAIPAGVTVTYSGTTYTGTLAASASTVNKIYMVWNGTAYDMYGTSADGGFSWVPMGTTTVDLSQYATKTELRQLEAKVDDLSQLWNFNKTGMTGSYASTVVRAGINIKNGVTYNFVVTDKSTAPIWFSLRDSDDNILIQLNLPGTTKGTFTANADYPNSYLNAICSANDSFVTGTLSAENQVIDSLDSDSATDALSARQGKVLDGRAEPYGVSVIGTAEITFSNNSFNVKTTRAADIRYQYKGVLKEKFISVDTEYSLSPTYAVAIDARDNSIATIQRDSLAPYHIVLVCVPNYADGWLDDSWGAFVGKNQSYTTAQQTEERGKINAQMYIGNIIRSFYGSGFINDYRYSSGKVKVSFATSAVIYCFMSDGTSNSVAIAANSEYLLGVYQALVFDTTESVSADKIKVKDISDVAVEDFVLIQTGPIDGEYKRYISGYYASRVNLETEYEEYNLHNVKKVYARDVDDVSAETSGMDNDFSVLISTDIHTNTQGVVQDTPVLNVVNRVSKNLDPDVVINLGDTVALGLEDSARAYYSLNDLKQSRERVDNSFFVVGNHDYNNLSSLSADRQPKASILPHKSLYNILGRIHEGDVVWGSKDAMYFYKDFPEKKIRLIVLNTLDKPEEWVTIDGVQYEKYPWLPNIMSANQVDWFIDTALNFTEKGTDKTNWTVLVCSHVSPAPNVPGNSASLGSLQIDNPQGVEICKIMEAFVAGTSKSLSYTDEIFGGNATLNRSANFTLQGAMKCIGWLSGHNHRDYKVTINGVTYVTTLCGYYTAGPDNNYITMTPNTFTEIAVDLLIIDKTNRTVTLKRYGAGSDRNWTY